MCTTFHPCIARRAADLPDRRRILRSRGHRLCLCRRNTRQELDLLKRCAFSTDTDRPRATSVRNTVTTHMPCARSADRIAVPRTSRQQCLNDFGPSRTGEVRDAHLDGLIITRCADVRMYGMKRACSGLSPLHAYLDCTTDYSAAVFTSHHGDGGERHQPVRQGQSPSAHTCSAQERHSCPLRNSTSWTCRRSRR